MSSANINTKEGNNTKKIKSSRKFLFNKNIEDIHKVTLIDICIYIGGEVHNLKTGYLYETNQAHA